jgi:polyphosphate kinase 2 (PPK2 family)
MREVNLDDLSTDGHEYTVDDEDDDDPVLLDRDGNRVETWRQGYPYDERMARKEYEQVKRRLQIELLKLQNWSKRTGATRDRVRGP